MSESSFDDVGRVWEVVQRVELPHKKYFKIGEVAQEANQKGAIYTSGG